MTSIRILAAIDVFSRYEINCLLQKETEEEELAALESQWLNVFSAPSKLRTDSSGAHMFQCFQRGAPESVSGKSFPLM